MKTGAVVCTDVPSKEPLRQVGVGRIGTPGSLGGVMLSTLARNVRYVGSIAPLGTLLPIPSTP